MANWNVSERNRNKETELMNKSSEQASTEIHRQDKSQFMLLAVLGLLLCFILGAMWLTHNSFKDDDENITMGPLTEVPDPTIPDPTTVEVPEEEEQDNNTPVSLPDFDRDGIPDSRDSDIDGDNVPNTDDDCPNTPLGITVDRNGCPKPSTPPPPTTVLNTYFADFDGDGLGDPSDKEKASSLPTGFVSNADDDCPTRKAEAGSSTGCPKLEIIQETPNIFIGERATFEVSYNDRKGSDQLMWSSNLDATIADETLPKSTFTFKKIGKVNISVTARNPADQFETNGVLENIQVQVPKKMLENLFLDNIKVGDFGDRGAPTAVRQKATKSDQKIMDFSTNSCVVVSENYTAYIGDGELDKFLSLCRQSDMTTVVTVLRPDAFSIKTIEYDDVTGKIKRIIIRDKRR